LIILQFTWDGVAYGYVEVETTLKEKLCGLCGNFNDDNTDELTLRNGELSKKLFRKIQCSKAV